MSRLHPQSKNVLFSLKWCGVRHRLGTNISTPKPSACNSHPALMALFQPLVVELSSLAVRKQCDC